MILIQKVSIFTRETFSLLSSNFYFVIKFFEFFAAVGFPIAAFFCVFICQNTYLLLLWHLSRYSEILMFLHPGCYLWI